MDLTRVDRIASAVGRQATRRLLFTALARASAGTALAALVAVPRGEEAEARKRRQPPLAFVAGAIVDASPTDGTDFLWQFHGSLAHPDSDTTQAFTLSLRMPVAATADQVRKQFVSSLREGASTNLDGLGQSVLPERIAVTLL